MTNEVAEVDTAGLDNDGLDSDRLENNGRKWTDRRTEHRDNY